MGCNLKDLATAEPITLDELQGQRIGVDAFLVAYQFLTSIRARGAEGDGAPLRDESGNVVAHLMGFLDRSTSMLQVGIEPIYFFDGRPHQLKQDTIAGRRERKDSAKTRWQAAVQSGDFELAQRLGAQAVEFRPEMVQDAKRMFDLLGVGWVDCAMEGEGEAAVHCAAGRIDAVASQDWDVLLYGSPFMIRNLMAAGSRRRGRLISAERISLQHLLDKHELNQEQLVDLGIMIGTDFHPGIRGIGPKTGLKLIRKHGTMEAVAEIKGFELPEDLDHIRGLFHSHPIAEGGLPTPQPVDEDALREFLQGERGFSDQRLKRALGRIEGRLRPSGQQSLDQWF